MQVQASAPGKLVIVGEYAVLHGAPAIAVAAGRRATAQVRSAGSNVLRIVNTGEQFAFTLDGARVGWSEPPGAQGAILEAAVAALHERGADVAALGDIEVTLASQEFYARDGAKYGLGSSAAVTVALSGCLQQALQGKTDLATALAVHRRFQRGQGSGVDVCASYTGGWVAVQSDPLVAELEWPAAVQVVPVWTGFAASTTAMLAQLARYATDYPDEHRALLADLATTAAVTLAACRRDAVTGLLDGLTAYAQQLRALDTATGLGIWSAEHDELAALAAAAGLVYKPSGAGAGDFGLAFGTDATAVQAFSTAAAAAGFVPADFALGVEGLRVTVQST